MERIALITASLAALSLTGPAYAQYIRLAPYNNYSYIAPGMPNYGIAQGSIFIMPNGGVRSTASQGVPLQTSLAGVTITVTVGGVTTQAIPYYVSPTQITAILPSKTPVGTGTVRAASGGSSFSEPITVVPSAFGLATIPAAGGNGLFVAAIAQDDSEDGQLLSQTNAANPGEYLTLWGSGLGPVSGDETQYQTPADLTNIPIEVDIGGVSATVTYHGRSIYPGLDQINVIVPAGVSGCNVSVVVTAGGVPSNTATIPVAAAGRNCSDPILLPVTSTEYQRLMSLDNVNVGAISQVALSAVNPPPVTHPPLSAYALFQRYSTQQVAYSSFLQLPSIGSCAAVYLSWLPPLASETMYGQLDAGPQINISGPAGPAALSRYGSGGGYDAPGSSVVVPPMGGTFTFDNGSGGPDVGSFRAGSSVNLAAPFVWTNVSAITAVNRAKGQLITWTGGVPGSFVYIYGFSYFYGPSPATPMLENDVYFTCSAPISDGQFTVPAAVLGSLPPTGWSVGGYPPSGNGYLWVVNGTVQRFTAPGLDLGLLFFGTGTGNSVAFN